MESAFRTLLTGSAVITAVCPAARISWGVIAQGKGLPAIALNVIGNTDGLTFKGPDGLWQGRVQVDCYGLLYDDARALAGKIITLLSGYKGGNFQGIFLDGRRDNDDPAAFGRPHRVSLDFKTKWRP